MTRIKSLEGGVKNDAGGGAEDAAGHGNVQWHPAFCAAVELTLRDDADILEFQSEVNLSRKPLQVDLVVVRKTAGRQVRAAIGKIFRTHNLFEYKSPGDELGIDTWYKTLAYGCLYKTEKADREDGIPLSEITLSLVREGKPDKLLAYLAGMGIRVDARSPGVYWCKGARLLFATQILVTSELPPGESVWLRFLTRDLQPQEADRLISETAALPAGSYWRRLADAVAQVSVGANDETFRRMKKEYPEMYDALKELMKDDLDQAREQGIAQGREEGLTQGREQGIAQGREQGIAQGREQGIAQGREEGMLAGMVRAYRDMGMSAAQIAERLNLPPGAIEDIIARL